MKEGIVKLHTTAVSCSIIIVNFNGRRLLKRCLDSLKQQSYRGGPVEILVVDNGSRDGSVEFVHRQYPYVAVLVNSENNYAKSLNLGISRSSGEFIAFLNNDVVVEEGWLAGLVELLKSDERIGCVGGKVLLMDGRINSVGIEQIEDFYFRDRGLGEEDRGQYDRVEPVDAITGGAVLWRRACLEDIGSVDEDYMMYLEDGDLAFRCKEKGWLMMYTPYSIVHHRFHGSSAGTDLCYYFCNRNRFLLLARHFPQQLPGSLLTSHFYKNRQLEWLYESIPLAMKKLYEHHPQEVIERILPEMRVVLTRIFGREKTDDLFRWIEVVLGLRRPRIGIYDHALHFAGGGQKYGCTVAQMLQHEYDITYIVNKPVTLQALKTWYDLDLSRCRLKIIPLPFFEERGVEAIDSGFAPSSGSNPFQPIEEESANYDIFINANMASRVSPRSRLSVFFCHFPDASRGRHFAADQYHYIITNSVYTGEWLKKLWGLSAYAIIYPPVDLKGPSIAKEDLILSVARFDVSGSKKQKEMIQAFEDLWMRHGQLMKGWRFILAGGSLRQNPYLEEIMALVHSTAAPMEIKANISIDELKDLYGRAKIFWHACGLNERKPRLIEHFGMTTVEAMQNGCVPIVLNGGGQKEIVEHGISGYRFESIAELQEYTARLISQPPLLQQLSEGAFKRGQDFHSLRFQQAITEFFDALLEEYKTIKRPQVSEFLTRRKWKKTFTWLSIPYHFTSFFRKGTARMKRIKGTIAQSEKREGMTWASSEEIQRYGRNEQDMVVLVYSGHDWNGETGGVFSCLAAVEERVRQRLFVRYGELADEETWRSANLLLVQSAGRESLLHACRALQRQVPIIVHEGADELKELCLVSNAGLFYSDLDELQECLDLLLSNEPLRKALGANGRRFVESCGIYPRS